MKSVMFLCIWSTWRPLPALPALNTFRSRPATKSPRDGVRGGANDGEEFEAFVHDLVARERDAIEGSAEHRMIMQQLQGVCRAELGNLIVEDYEMSAKLHVPRLLVPVA